MLLQWSAPLDRGRDVQFATSFLSKVANPGGTGGNGKDDDALANAGRFFVDAFWCAGPTRRHPPPSTKMAFDLRQLAIAAIFVWIVNTWIVISTSSQREPLALPGGGVDAPRMSSSSSGVVASLGGDQSDGFFDDVSDEHWRTAQAHHAALFPNYYSDLRKYAHGPDDRGKLSMLRHSNMWYGQNFQVEFVCPLARRLPSDSMADGPKWVSATIIVIGRAPGERPSIVLIESRAPKVCP